MDKIEQMVTYGTISMLKIGDRYGLFFDPAANKNPSYKSSPVLIKREHLEDAFVALEDYLSDPLRGPDDFPVAFFDSDKL